MANYARYRKALLAKVHLAKKDLGLNDQEYRAILGELFGVESAGQLPAQKLAHLVEHFEARGWQAQPKARRKKDSHGYPRQSMPDRKALLSKIEAQLAEKGRAEGRHVPWAYAAGILQRMYGVERMEWANAEQLRGVVAALHRDARRYGRSTG
jgi:phage gp16-like protein